LVKNSFGIDVERFLCGLADSAGVLWNDEIERLAADELVMTWKQIRALQDAGMEVHSHTRTHRVLQTVQPNELESELAGARADLEEHLERRVTGVAYPVGRFISESPVLRAAVRASGYELGFSNGSGHVVAREARYLELATPFGRGGSASFVFQNHARDSCSRRVVATCPSRATRETARGIFVLNRMKPRSKSKAPAT